jgi:DNA polymerase-3 subunit alpha
MTDRKDDTLVQDEVGFVHLHVHSSYSLLEGAIQVGTLTKLAAGDGQPAMALTDTNNLFGALEFSEKLASAGVQPIAGVQLSVDFADEDTGGRKPVQSVTPHLVLLATSEAGYSNLMKLVTQACLVAGAGAPVATVDHVAECCDDLIALTGGFGGPLDAALRAGAAGPGGSALKRLQAIFGDRLYVEIQRHGASDGAAIEAGLSTSPTAGLPLVATNEPFFAKPADYEAHDALLCIADGRLVGRRQPPPPHAGALFQEPGGDEAALSPTCRRRPPTRWRSPGAAPGAQACASRSCRASPSERRRGSG